MPEEEPLTGWDVLGIADLENIPSGQHISWKFFNAFFSAFKERAYYTDEGEAPSEYDDKKFDGPQIASNELRRRLRWFNQQVGRNFAYEGDFGPTRIDTSWVKEESWVAVGEFTSGLSEDSPWPDVKFWDLAAITEIFTEDELKFVFTEEYSFYVNFRTSYWSGIYKLLTQCMKYRKMSIKTDIDPEPERAYIVCNGTAAYNTLGTIDEFEDNILDSISNPTITPDGTRTISEGSVGMASSKNQDGNGVDEAGVRYEGMAMSPFYKTPTAMEVRTNIYRRRGRTTRTLDKELLAFSELWSMSDIVSRTDVVPATSTEIWVEGEFQSHVWVPDVVTWNSIGRQENLNLPTTFNELEMTNTIDISSVPDIRTDNTLDLTLATAPAEGNEDGIQVNHRGRSEQFEYTLSQAMAKIPEDDLIYKKVEEE